MKYTRDNKGVALMMVMMLSVSTLAAMSMVLYMISVSTRFSGIQKRYATAIEAAHGAEYVIMQILKSGSVSDSLKTDLVAAIPPGSASCFATKRDPSKFMSDWDASCSKTVYIDKDKESTYDISFNIGQYKLFGKVLAHVPNPNGWQEGSVGSSDPSSRGNLLDIGFGRNVSGGGDSAGGGFAVAGLFAMEMDVMSLRGSKERGRFVMLIQY